MDLERRHLAHLAAVAEHRNVTRAAEALGITQPALSRSIQEIERVLGLRCFDRLPQGVVPTPACTALLEGARAVLRDFEELEGAAQRLAERFAGPLAVGFGPAAAAGGAMREVGRFLTRHPGVRCRIALDAPDALAERLRSLELDFFAADHRALDAEGPFAVESIAYDALLLCRPEHPLLRAKHPERHVARYPVAVMGPPTAGLEALRRFLQAEDPAVGADWMPALALDQAHALRQILLDGDFVGASAAHAHAEDLRTGTLRAVPLPRAPYQGRVGPVRLRDRTLSPAAEALWKLVADALRADVAAGAAIAAAGGIRPAGG
jgi:DNA-binding transcriptional LysR family regulator